MYVCHVSFFYKHCMPKGIFSTTTKLFPHFNNIFLLDYIISFIFAIGKIEYPCRTTVRRIQYKKSCVTFCFSSKKTANFQKSERINKVPHPTGVCLSLFSIEKGAWPYLFVVVNNCKGSRPSFMAQNQKK